MKRLDFSRLLVCGAVLALAGCSGESTGPPVPVASVTVTATPDTVLVSATLQVTATTRDAAGNVLTGRAVTWTSSNAAVATVSGTGLVTGVTPGDVTVTAASEGKSGTGAVSVRPQPSVPAAPVNVTASAGPTYNAITVQWQNVPGATSYNLYWGTTPGVTTQNGTKIGGVTSAFVHTGLTANTTYYYVLTAANDIGEGAASATTRATASADIALNTCQPAAGGLVGSQLSVGVQMVSRFQLGSVTASVSGRSTNLVFEANSLLCNRRFGGPAWVGTISLAGLPRGAMTLTISATDVFANVAEASVWFVYDQPPTLTVAAPNDFSVARPNLRVAASCQDDDPRGCTLLTVSVEDGPTLASAQAGIDQTVSLANYDGQSVVVVFAGSDSAGQVTRASRRVFVESSTQLNEVASITGLIWDVLPDRILFLDQSKGGNALTIRDRSLGSDVVIFDQVGHIPQYGFLTPLGAMFFEQSGDIPTRVLHEWQPGGLTDFGQTSADLVVKGRYALFRTAAGLTRRDVVAGVNTIIAPEAGNNPSVAANGDVAYWTRSYQVFRFRNQVSTQLTSDATLWNTYPVTDGVNVVYGKHTPCCGSQQHQIAVYDASGEHILTPADLVDRWPGRDYQAANGWVAYTKSGIGGELQVWSRSPTGQELQVTKFGTSSSINALGANGEIVLVNSFAGVSRRYLAVPSYGSSLRDISSSLGSAFFQNGGLFITIGRSLFQVNP